MMMHALCLFLVVSLSFIDASAAQLKAVDVKQESSKTSLYLTISGPFTHKLIILNNPKRVVVDLTGISSEINLSQLGIVNSLIQRVRTGKPDKNTWRLVLEVSQNVQASSASWKPQGPFNGIRIDLQMGKNNPPPRYSKPNLVSAAKPTPKTYTKPVAFKKSIDKPVRPIPLTTKNVPTFQNRPGLAHNKPVLINHRPPQSLRNVVIVLDAGHGGKDPGAKGPRHSREKDVVLAITLKLKQLIDKQPGMRAVLTRSGDYYVGLRQRLDIARKYNGDVFVSIHADAFNNPHSNGASVFALSQSGATSEAARWIAEKENYSELGGVNLGDLDDRNGVVRSVLIDLSQTATINAGLQMGGRVLGQLDNFTRLHNNKVEQARFVVLKSPDIPSILVETGFISNPREEKNLTSPAYQNRLSQAIFQGIKEYFWENPPHGSRIEALASTHLHIVKSGETLPAIANRYHVSVAALQAMNNLGRSAPRPGSKLVIPSAWA